MLEENTEETGISGGVNIDFKRDDAVPSSLRQG